MRLADLWVLSFLLGCDAARSSAGWRRAGPNSTPPRASGGGCIPPAHLSGGSVPQAASSWRDNAASFD